MAPLTSLQLWLLGAHLLLTSPLNAGRVCRKCTAGYFLKKKSCECLPCGPGTFTSDSNRESRCRLCYRDCRADLFMKVVKDCTNTSDLQCECEKGFICNERNFDGFCIDCQDSRDPLTADPSMRQISTQPLPSVSNQFSPAPISGNATEPRTDTTQNQLIAILCPLVIVGGLSLVVIFCFGCPGNKTRLKQSVMKLCTVEAKVPAHKTRETSDRRQQVPMATANMGSVHVHNPGTVIFSLLGEVSGQMGQTKEEKTAVKEPSEEVAYCTVCQPMPSPFPPLSEEEHSGDHVFFPSQEQGKDSCVSMEEQL